MLKNNGKQYRESTKKRLKNATFADYKKLWKIKNNLREKTQTTEGK